MPVGSGKQTNLEIDMKRIMQGALVLGLLVGIGYMLWQLRGEDGPSSAKEAVPAAKKAPSKAAHVSSTPVALTGAPAFASEEDPPGTLRLEGQVLGDGDLPVGAARVTINTKPRRMATTEEDGSFVFDKLVGRTYTLWANQGDLAGGPVMHELTASSEPAVVRMRPGVTVTVTVLSGKAGALAGADVRLQTGERRQATTDGKGVAIFRGVREGTTLITAVAPGHAMGQKRINVPHGSRQPVAEKLTLNKGAPVSGVVVDQAGSPVVGAEVSPRELGDLHAGLRHEALQKVKSVQGGRFTIDALAPGTYRIEAQHKEYAPGASDQVQVGGSPVSGVRIALKAGAKLAGKVVTARGEAAAWATVRVGPDEPGQGGAMRARFRKVTADQAGAFKVTGLARTKVAVAASTSGGSSAIVTVDLAEKPEVTDVRLLLDQEGTIAGVVVDGQGQPVPEAQVSALPDIFAKGAIKQLYMRGLGGQLTDGGGRFKFRGMPEGTYRLRASRSGVTSRLYRMNKGVEARTGDTNVKLELKSPGGVKGLVLDQEGAPVTRFTVTVGEPPSTPVRSDEGRFSVGSIPPGKHDVTVTGQGYAPAVQKDVTVASGSVKDLGTLTLTRGRSVSGMVVDAKGGPVAGATVVVGKKIVGDGKKLLAELGKAFEEASGIRRAVSGEDGKYTVLGISKDKQLIAADHTASGRSAAVAVPEGKEDANMDLRLLPLGSLQGKVTYGDKPAAGVMVVTSQKGGRNQSLLVTTDGEGLYLIERIPAGEYDLMAMSKTGLGGKSGGTSATIVAGRKATADIHVEMGDVTLEVKVGGADGKPVPLAQVFLFQDGLVPRNGKEVQEVFLGKAKSGGAMMAFAKPPAAADFKQVTAAAYSVCVLPISGDIQDATFRARLQKHANKLAVHCRPCTVTSSPSKQTFTATVPQMLPLPE